jgi:hypothetical protein
MSINPRHTLQIITLAGALALVASCGTPEKQAPPAADPIAQPSPEPANPQEQVKQFKDKKSTGWAFKDDDQAFVLERLSGCTIKWNVITYHARPKELLVTVKDSCRFDGGLTRSLPYYGQILDAVLAKYSKDKIKIFQSSSWRTIKAWDQDLAVSAIESGLWKTFLKKREENEDLANNKVFVEVFNQGNIARKLSEVFEARGLTLKLKSVDDTRESRFKNLPFAYQYAAYSASNVKVPVNAGTYVFEVKPVGEP